MSSRIGAALLLIGSVFVPANASAAPTPTRGFITPSFIYWTVKGDAVPVLASTLPLGLMGATPTLFGGTSIGHDWRMGYRVLAGGDFGKSGGVGLEGEWFQLRDVTTKFSASSDGGDRIERPFFNVLIGRPDSVIVAGPTGAGSIGITETSRLFGGDVAFRKTLTSGGSNRVSVLAGYRVLHAADQLAIASHQLLAQVINEGITVNDSFKPSTTFQGAEGGASGDFQGDRVGVTWRATVAVGSSHSIVPIAGSTTIAVTNGATTTASGGVLALSSNIGTFRASAISIAPQGTVDVRFRASSHCDITAGYGFLYWTGVLRAGNTIDTTLNTNFLPPSSNTTGPSRPRVQTTLTSLWAQGLSVGVTVRF